jgi:hypothetical protein
MQLITCLLIGIAAATTIELLQWGLGRLAKRAVSNNGCQRPTPVNCAAPADET